MLETTILCSGFGLGFYIPGLLIQKALLNKGVDAKVDVFEYYMKKEKKEKIVISKKAYQENFAVAKMATKYHLAIDKSIDFDLVKNLVDMWKVQKRKNFIVLSGHWIYILELYQEKMKKENLQVDLLYVDSDLAPSWKSIKKYRPNYNDPFHDRYLYDFNRKKINYIVKVESKFIPYKNRRKELVIHGGGWGLGTYKETIKRLTNTWKLNVVAYNESESEDNNSIKYYMNMSKWKAWEPDIDGNYTFPPYVILNEKPICYHYTKKYHWLFELILNCKAIISKPGAGTLIDSIATATPLIMLEPFGSHEYKNSIIWEALGFGITFSKWEKSGYSIDLLEQMHYKLKVAHDNNRDYSDFYFQEILGGFNNENVKK